MTGVYPADVRSTDSASPVERATCGHTCGSHGREVGAMKTSIDFGRSGECERGLERPVRSVPLHGVGPGQRYGYRVYKLLMAFNAHHEDIDVPLPGRSVVVLQRAD
jgi:hypothetical protein